MGPIWACVGEGGAGMSLAFGAGESGVGMVLAWSEGACADATDGHCGPASADWCRHGARFGRRRRRCVVVGRRWMPAWQKGGVCKGTCGTRGACAIASCKSAA